MTGSLQQLFLLRALSSLRSSNIFTGQSVGLPEKLKIKRENPGKAGDVLLQILLKSLAARKL